MAERDIYGKVPDPPKEVIVRARATWDDCLQQHDQRVINRRIRIRPGDGKLNALVRKHLNINGLGALRVLSYSVNARRGGNDVGAATP